MNTPSVGSVIYGHHLHQHQQQQAHHHHHHHQRASTVAETIEAGSHGNGGDVIPQFDARCRHISTDAGVLGTSVYRTQQRQPGTSFSTSRSVPELPNSACVDRYDYMLLGCDQFAKIS